LHASRREGESRRDAAQGDASEPYDAGCGDVGEPYRADEYCDGFDVYIDCKLLGRL
jgi:hypothetical protein